MLPDWNALEWGGFWLYVSFGLFVGFVAWDGLVRVVRRILEARAARRAERAEVVAELFEPSYSECYCVQCIGKRNPLQDKGGPS